MSNKVTMEILSNYEKHLVYIKKVIENNQSVTVLKPENKSGKKVCKMLMKNYIGGIDGFNDGASFVGLTELGNFSVKLKPVENNDYYVTWNLGVEGGGTSISGMHLDIFLKGIKAVRK